MVGYGRVTAQTLSNTGLGNGKIQYNFNTNYSVSHISATRVESHSTPHYEPFYYCGCSSPSFQPINRCSVNHPDEYRIFDLSKTVGTFNGFGQLIKKSVFDKAGALLSYSKNYYKQISEISESYTKEAQGITYYTPHTYSHLCQVTPTYNIGTGLYTYNCTVNGNTINMIQTFTTSLSFTIQNNHYSRNYSVLDKTESYANGITTTSIINERDPISMQPLSSTVVDPTQGAITTTIKPAYTNTVSYSSMGLKSACPTCATNENMVSLVEEQRVIKQPVFRNSDGVISYNSASPGILMGASKQTYANTVYHRKYNTGTNRYESVSEAANTWLPYESYTALTNASTPSTTTSPTWKKTNTVTLFSTTNKALESEGMSGRKSAVKFGYKNLYPLASISDANYNCFGFTGFEDTINVGTGSSPVWHFGGEFSKGTMRMAGTPWIKPHTGYYVAAVPAGQFGPELQLSGFDYGRIYRASVWVHKNSPDNTALVMACDGSVGGTSTYNWQQVLKNDPNNIIVGDWILMSVQLTVPENYLPSGGSHGNGFGISVLNSGSTTAWFDDLMIRPVDAPITGTVYDPKTARVIATLDNENFASWFEYDAAGRVTATYVETRLGVKKTSETQYNFSRNN
jgi:YD repeat-containing protein